MLIITLNLYQKENKYYLNGISIILEQQPKRIIRIIIFYNKIIIIYRIWDELVKHLLIYQQGFILTSKKQESLKLIISNQQLIELDLVKLILDADKVRLIDRLIKPNSDRVLMSRFTEQLLLRYVQNKINLLFQVQKQIFNVRGIITFRHIFTYKNNQISQEKNLIPNDILLYFQDICQKAKKNEAGYIFGFPITKNKKTSSNSASIDFLLVKYSSKKQGYNFVSFNVSVSKQKSLVSNKLSKATLLVSQVLQKIKLIKQAANKSICLEQAVAKKQANQKFRLKIYQWQH